MSMSKTNNFDSNTKTTLVVENVVGSKINLKFSVANILSGDLSSIATDLSKRNSVNSKNLVGFRTKHVKNSTNDANNVSICGRPTGANDDGNLPISDSWYTGVYYADSVQISDSWCTVKNAAENIPIGSSCSVGTNDTDNAGASVRRCADTNDADNAVIIDSRCTDTNDTDNEIISDSCCAEANDAAGCCAEANDAAGNLPISDSFSDVTIDDDNVLFSDRQAAGLNKSIVNNKQKETKCNLCDKFVKKYSASERCHVAKDHAKNFGIDWLYQCVACGYRKISMRAVKRHLSHGCPKGKFACIKRETYLENVRSMARFVEICNLAFPSVGFHVPPTNNIRDFVCTFCGKTVHFYYKKRHALQHVKAATGVQWLFKCLICKKFSNFGKVLMHHHVKSMHNEQNFRKEIEYAENPVIKDVTKRSIAIAFPNV